MKTGTWRKEKGTWVGILAILFWSTTSGMARGLMESLGPFTYLAVTCLGGGLLLLVIDFIGQRRSVAPWRIPRAYLASGGFCFVFYVSAYSVSLHLASSRQSMLQLNLVNYLWPTFTLAFAVFMFGHPVRWTLLVSGAALALTGAGVATLDRVSVAEVGASFAANKLPFTLMLSAAVAWGLYGNLAKRFGSVDGPGGAAWFLCATGLLFAALGGISGENVEWDRSLLVPLSYATVFPTALAYACWELGMKHGNQMLLGSLSYLIPITSTMFACWYLDVVPHPSLLIGCVLCVAGSFLSRQGAIRRVATGPEKKTRPS